VLAFVHTSSVVALSFARPPPPAPSLSLSLARPLASVARLVFLSHLLPLSRSLPCARPLSLSFAPSLSSACAFFLPVRLSSSRPRSLAPSPPPPSPSARRRPRPSFCPLTRARCAAGSVERELDLSKYCSPATRLPPPCDLAHRIPSVCVCVCVRARARLRVHAEVGWGRGVRPSCYMHACTPALRLHSSMHVGSREREHSRAYKHASLRRRGTRPCAATGRHRAGTAPRRHMHPPSLTRTRHHLHAPAITYMHPPSLTRTRHHLHAPADERKDVRWL